MEPKIYLFNDNGMDTGEVFYSWDELYDWFWSVVGTHPDDRTKFEMKNGRHFSVGSRYFRTVCDDETADLMVA